MRSQVTPEYGICDSRADIRRLELGRKVDRFATPPASSSGCIVERAASARGWREVVGRGFVGLALAAVKLKLAGVPARRQRACAQGRSEPV